MLDDLDRSLAAWLRRLLPAGTAVRFGAPPPAAGARPGLHAFLYDVREEPATAPPDAVLVRDAAGGPLGWQPPPRAYRVSYLLTAWPGGSRAASPDSPDGPGTPGTAGEPGRADDADGAARAEHALLGAVLLGCAAEPALPADCLRGVLAGWARGVPLTCASAARAADPDRLCAGLGIGPRAALDLALVAPVVPALLTDLAAPPGAVELGVSRGAPPRRPAAPEPGPRRRHVTEHD